MICREGIVNICHFKGIDERTPPTLLTIMFAYVPVRKRVCMCISVCVFMYAYAFAAFDKSVHVSVYIYKYIFQCVRVSI